MTQLTTKFRGRVITVEAGPVDLPNGRRAEYEIVRHPGGAAVVAVDARGQVCLLRQYRPAAGGWVWELPAGRLEPQEPPLETARRELVEEAGRHADGWRSLGEILSSPGVFAEVLHLFLAEGLTEVPQHHEDFEVIEVHWIGMDDAVQRALDGRICDAKSVIGLLRANALISRGKSRAGA